MDISKDELYEYCHTLVGIRIDDMTKIFEDLGMVGLDTDSFMIQLQEKYSLDLSTYNHSKYDQGDPNLPDALRDLFFRLFSHKKWEERSIKTFTGLHLYEVVRAGKWFNPRENG